MLKVEMNAKKGVFGLEVCGSTLDITADVSLLIKMIYDRMDIETRDCFAEAITKFMNKEVYKMDSDELEEETETAEKEKEKKAKEVKEELMKDLTELFEGLKKLVEEK